MSVSKELQRRFKDITKRELDANTLRLTRLLKDYIDNPRPLDAEGMHGADFMILTMWSERCLIDIFPLESRYVVVCNLMRDLINRVIREEGLN